MVFSLDIKLLKLYPDNFVQLKPIILFQIRKWDEISSILKKIIILNCGFYLKLTCSFLESKTKEIGRIKQFSETLRQQFLE